MTAPEVTSFRDPAYDSELRDAVCGWLRANDIDPAVVPAEEKPDCSFRDGAGIPLGGHTITTRVRIQASPDSKGVAIRPLSNRLEEATITRPMKVEPPKIVQTWLDARCPTCGR